MRTSSNQMFRAKCNRDNKATTLMKWHNVSSAIWKWIFKIKCITIEIIVSFWAHFSCPRTHNTFRFVLCAHFIDAQYVALLRTQTIIWINFYSFPLLSIQLNHMAIQMNTNERDGREKKNLINIFTFERAMASNRLHTHVHHSQWQ